MSNLTIIPNSESAVTVNQLALFLDSSEVQKAKETSKDLLADIAESLKRMKRIGAKNKDFSMDKRFEKIPLTTFKFICNQYKINYQYWYGNFRAEITAGKCNHCIILESEPIKVQLQEIENVTVIENREGVAK